MNVESTAAARQAITGWNVGIDTSAFCQRCMADLGEGDIVTAYAYRRAGEQLVSVARLYCAACDRRRIDHPARGCYEWLAEARLAVTADVATQSHGLTLRGVEILDEYGPKNGDQP